MGLFLEVAKCAPNAQWYFGCRGIHDLENTQHLVNALGINPVIFRTDGISVTTISESVRKIPVHKTRFKEAQSSDKDWSVQWSGKKINIVGNNGKTNRIMQENIKKCVFSPDGDILLL